jgi:hypothetical protein
MKYVVDIDGTICEHVHRDAANRGRFGTGEIYYDRIEKINKLYDEGHIIIYHTARGHGPVTNPEGRFDGDTIQQCYKDWFTYTEQQLLDWGCRYTELIMGKYSGDVYIDDKAINSDVFF